MDSAILTAETLAAKASLRERFAQAQPFRHVVVDGFFQSELARSLVAHFPKADGASRNQFGAAGRKAFHSDLAKLAAPYRAVHEYFASPAFLRWVGEVTGIDGLLYDDANFGGGTHENFDGRDLRPHVDFNIHPVTKLHRRINLIVYLNEDWQPQWGGAIALHSDPRDPLDRVVEYQPDFNRCIIFETNERSWHGFECIRLPADQKHRSRKSLSIYLYSLERPEEEIHSEHTTFFVPRQLPSRFAAGRTLDGEDERELGELMGQRDRLIALYQEEQRKRESGTVEAARLRIALAQAQSTRCVPALGYVRTSAPSGGYADGWAAGELRFTVTAMRPAYALRLRMRIPEGIPDGATIAVEADGSVCAVQAVAAGIVEIDAPASIAPNAPVQIRITCSATANHKRLGISADERDLGFFLEEVTFEHALPQALTLERGPLALADAAPETVCFIGDCQAGAFNGLLLRDRKRSGVNVLATTRWRAWFRADMFFEDGRFGEEMTRLFWEMRCIVPSEEPAPGEVFTPVTFRQFEGRFATRGFAVRSPERQRTVVVSCGAVDAQDLDHELYSRYGYDAAAVPETFDAHMIRDLIEPHCRPLFAGLRALRKAGMERLFLLSVAPPSTPEHDEKPARIRYVTRRALNEAYRDFCTTQQIGFLDAWSELTIDGVRDDRCFIDDEHLSARGALAVMNRLYELL